MNRILRQPAGLLLKQLLLVFWVMLFSLAALTNLVDLLGEVGVLEWTFLDSNNFDYLRSVVEVYDVGPDLTKLLLFGAFAIETVAALLFARALAGLSGGAAGMRNALLALSWGVIVWTLFVFSVEFFVAYEAGSVFRELLALTVLTALALVLIPDEAGEETS